MVAMLEAPSQSQRAEARRDALIKQLIGAACGV